MRSIFSKNYLLVFVWLFAANSPLLAITVTGLTVFGDSLSDLDNSSFLHPADYYDGRWSNGPVWVEHLSASLGLATLVSNNGQPTSSGSNFAFGGSTSGSGLSYGIVPNLQTQIASFLNHPNGAGPGPDMATRLFIVWSGGNDIINDAEGGAVADPAAMAENLSLAISSLYGAGARQFLIPNLPALGFKPSFMGTPQEEQANDLVDAFNAALSFELGQLDSTLNESTILRLDVYGLVNNILADPADYGFTNVVERAYGQTGVDAAEYLFWDNTHPTTAGHQLIANEALAVIPEPQTAALVALGLVVVWGLAGRRKEKPRAL